jgi:hypothetical protein
MALGPSRARRGLARRRPGSPPPHPGQGGKFETLVRDKSALARKRSPDRALPRRTLVAVARLKARASARAVKLDRRRAVRPGAPPTLSVTACRPRPSPAMQPVLALPTRIRAPLRRGAGHQPRPALASSPGHLITRKDRTGLTMALICSRVPARTRKPARDWGQARHQAWFLPQLSARPRARTRARPSRRTTP